MSVLRAHDYPLPEFRPNARALRGILAAFGCFTFVFLCMVIALLPPFHAASRTTNPPAPRCTCDTACACHRRVQMAEVAHGQQQPLPDRH
jgi:hypothetical protein